MGRQLWCPVWPLPLEPPAWACAPAPVWWCLADPTHGATSGLWVTQVRWGEVRHHGSSTLCAPHCGHPVKVEM